MCISHIAYSYVFVSHTACVGDIALVVDTSGSIRDNNVAGEPDNWDTVIDFLQRIAKGLVIGDDLTHVGAVSFGECAACCFMVYCTQNTHLHSFILIIYVICVCICDSISKQIIQSLL